MILEPQANSGMAIQLGPKPQLKGQIKQCKIRIVNDRTVDHVLSALEVV
jgi:hypothetical protein